ncbi:MAG TPA: hypothetical protein VK552_18860, partial [Reyranella sp.]|nr:hypothetical protein [Reyranella sp.]
MLRNVKCFFDGGLFVHRKGRTFFGLIVLGADAVIACSPLASCWRAVVRNSIGDVFAQAALSTPQMAPGFFADLGMRVSQP